ncbi:MAG: long-chain fatty acid--CoA ligase [Oligoflexia bacterium]|nr:long-chain fatty acid--CoA ligase [Oligoflexia bacterium]
MRRLYKNLVEMQENSCHLFRDREIFGVKNSEGHYKWITYGQFKQMVDHLRAGLALLGVGPGDKVGIISRNSVEWAVSCYATMGLRAHFVAMYENQNLDDWRYIINDSGLMVVFIANQKIYESVVGLKSVLPKLEHVVSIVSNKEHKEHKEHEERDGGATSVNYQQLLIMGQQRPLVSMYPETHEPMGLIYTSGTTGNPKGVILSHGNILSNLYVIPDLVTILPEDRSLSVLPWAHIFGQTAEVHNLLYSGFSTAIAESANTIAQNILEIKPTVLFAVPRLYNRIYEGINDKVNKSPLPLRSLFYKAMEIANKRRAGEILTAKQRILLHVVDMTLFALIRKKFGGRLRYAVSGASALSVKVAKFINNLGITVLEAYGLSETSPLVSANTEHKFKFGSAGVVARNDFADIRVVIDHSVFGESVQSCEEGEVIVYGPNVMLGYHNLPEETKRVMTVNGGFRTGDLGRIDEEGFLYITGRIKEQYKLENGKYVVPSVIEDHLKNSPYIDNAFVYGSDCDYNVVLICVNRANLLDWINKYKAGDTGDLRAILSSAKLKALYQNEINCLKDVIKNYEIPRKFVLLDDEWSVENGMFTPTLKLRRQQVYQRYKGVIDALYVCS